MKLSVKIIFLGVLTTTLAAFYYKGKLKLFSVHLSKFCVIPDDLACDKSKQPRKVIMEQCCPSLPRYSDLDIFTNCEMHCIMWTANPNQPGAKKCCILNCTLTMSGILDGNKTFNQSAMTQLYQKAVPLANATVWHPIIQKVIKKCYSLGKKYTTSVIDNMTPQCETRNITLALNITRCVRREMFFSCEDKQMTQENCQLLKAYGQECVKWPWQCDQRIKVNVTREQQVRM